jgi:adenine deaminase
MVVSASLCSCRSCETYRNFFDPQPHLQRGVPFETIVDGIHQALSDAQNQLQLSSRLIMCFVRHLSVDHALHTLELSLPHRGKIFAVGLDSTEKDNHPQQYKDLFERARSAGYQTVAHAGEEGPAEYISACLDHLQVQRIDHGVRCEDDLALMERLREEQVPLTMCPLSNIRLRVFDHISQHNIKKLLDYGICVTVNSDDPGYFGGFITDNFIAIATDPTLALQKSDILKLVQNSINAAFVDEDYRLLLHQQLNEFAQVHL